MNLLNSLFVICAVIAVSGLLIAVYAYKVSAKKSLVEKLKERISRENKEYKRLSKKIRREYRKWKELICQLEKDRAVWYVERTQLFAEIEKLKKDINKRMDCDG